MRSLILADLKRRSGNAADNNPSIAGRPDLTSWIAEVPAWITAYNALNGTAFTIGNVLNDGASQRAFVDHFYGGLPDDELRALADVAASLAGFGRVNAKPVLPKTAISDAVDGTGYGRNLYKLAAVNASGSVSGVTGASGPVLHAGGHAAASALVAETHALPLPQTMAPPSAPGPINLTHAQEAGLQKRSAVALEANKAKFQFDQLPLAARKIDPTLHAANSVISAHGGAAAIEYIDPVIAGELLHLAKEQAAAAAATQLWFRPLYPRTRYTLDVVAGPLLSREQGGLSSATSVTRHSPRCSQRLMPSACLKH